MIVRARSVVTMDGAPIPNGAVVVNGDHITDVGEFAEVRRRNAGGVLDLGHRILMPGLINAHCHLDYTCLRGQIPPQPSFADWIRAINQRKAALKPEDYLKSIEAGFNEAARYGTTTIANLEAFPALLPRLPVAPVRIWWFAEMIDVRERVSAEAAFAEMRGAFAKRGVEPRGGIGLAPHAPYTASRALYAEAQSIGKTRRVPLTTHLAESAAEMEMFRNGRGTLFDFLKSIGRATNDCGAATPLALLRDILDESWIIAHLNELAEEDFRQLARGPKFHIVHCPRSHAYFHHAPFALRRLQALGFNICIGTDSLASNDDLSLFRELRALAANVPMLSAAELFALVTTNAAAALGQSGTLGRLREGFAADLIAVPSTAESGDLFEELLEFDQPVPWMMVGGELVPRS